MKYLYGIDIGGTTVKMGLFGEELRKMERTSCQILHRQ